MARRIIISVKQKLLYFGLVALLLMPMLVTNNIWLSLLAFTIAVVVLGSAQCRLVFLNECLNYECVELTDRLKRNIVQAVYSSCRQYFDGTPIDSYVVHVVDNRKVIVKIGDDECMVEVDDTLLKKDFAEALEKAKLDWEAAKEQS